MASLYLNYPMDSACPFFRFLLPARFCRKAFPKSTIEVGEGLPAGYDIYAMHGLLSEVAIIEIARMKRRSGAKFIWSVDDDWLSVPDWNPAKPSQDGMAMYDLAKTMADWILCSTPHLASTFSDVSEKVLYAPNLLDLDQFPPRPYTMEGDRRNYSMSVELPIRVVWAGGATHREDVAIITDAIDQLIRTHRRKIAVVYQGMAPPPKLLTEHLHRGLFHQPSVPFASYQQILNSIKADVYLAPLAPVEFNLSKSNLRVMEGWALMTAPVASAWGEYGCIRNGVDGRLAVKPDEWLSALNRLVTDHEYRLSLAAEGRQRVEAEYAWNNPKCREPWYKAFSKILGEDPVLA